MEGQRDRLEDVHPVRSDGGAHGGRQEHRRRPRRRTRLQPVPQDLWPDGRPSRRAAMAPRGFPSTCATARQVPARPCLAPGSWRPCAPHQPVARPPTRSGRDRDCIVGIAVGALLMNASPDCDDFRVGAAPPARLDEEARPRGDARHHGLADGVETTTGVEVSKAWISRRSTLDGIPAIASASAARRSRRSRRNTRVPLRYSGDRRGSGSSRAAAEARRRGAGATPAPRPSGSPRGGRERQPCRPSPRRGRRPARGSCSTRRAAWRTR